MNPKWTRDGDYLRIDETKVPESFRPLIPFAKFWSVTDDVERSELMAATPVADLQAFVDAVAPHITAIQQWLDQNRPTDTAVPPELCLFETMIEPYYEAKISLSGGAA